MEPRRWRVYSDFTTVPMDDKVDADDTLTLHIPKSVKQVILWKDGRRIALDT